MKLKFLLPVLLLCMGVISSCQKEFIDETTNPPTNPPTNPVTGEFRAKVDGVQWVGNEIAVAARLTGLINLTGLQSDGKLLTITLIDSGVHNYTMNMDAMNAAAYADSTRPNTNAFTSNSSMDLNLAGGNVQITSIDTVNKRISGTFSFKVFRPEDTLSLSLTEGVFNNLSYESPLPPPVGGVGTDSFSVKKNGTQFPGGQFIVANNAGFISMMAMSGSESVTINFVENISVGAHQFEYFTTTGNSLVYSPNLTDPTGLVFGDGGTINILEHNTTTRRLRGNFNVVAKSFPVPGTVPNVTFADGYFSVTY